jgi:hypothetical protein
VHVVAAGNLAHWLASVAKFQRRAPSGVGRISWQNFAAKFCNRKAVCKLDYHALIGGANPPAGFRSAMITME